MLEICVILLEISAVAVVIGILDYVATGGWIK